MEIVLQILRDSIENGRTYSSYWKFSPDKQAEEQHIGACLLGYLETIEDWAGAKIASNETDPPDCIGRVAGRKFGIEVTELVHEKMVRDHQLRHNAERKGAPAPAKAAFPGAMAEWTASSLRTRLAAIVRVKDKKAAGGPFSPYIVAIHTDEPMITPELVKEALATMMAHTNHIDRAYLLLSYDPRAEDFPNHIPVFRLRLTKKS